MSPWSGSRRFRLALFMGAVLLPLLLLAHAPVVAALLPGAILAVASLDRMGVLDREANPTSMLVDADDAEEQRRIAHASPVSGRSRVIGPA